MHPICKVKVRIAALAVILLSVFSQFARAYPVTVQEIGVDPARTVGITVNGFYSGYAYAGVINLLVDGVERDAFCIDPYHFSSTSALGYDLVPLTQAPKPPGPMSADQARTIAALWALAYNPAISADAAAGLQLAIWEVVAGSNFSIWSGNDYGVSALLAQAQAYQGPLPDLVGLTRPFDGQDYVIANPNPVPDGGSTMMLFGITLVAVGFVTRRFQIAA